MDNQKTKIILIAGVVILTIILAIIATFTISNKKNNSSHESKQEVAKKNPIKKITGKIGAVDIDTIEVITEGGNKLTLSVSMKGASFIKQTVQENGHFLDEDIALSDIPKDKVVNIQYNDETNEVMLIVVK